MAGRGGQPRLLRRAHASPGRQPEEGEGGQATATAALARLLRRQRAPERRSGGQSRHPEPRGREKALPGSAAGPAGCLPRGGGPGPNFPPRRHPLKMASPPLPPQPLAG